MTKFCGVHPSALVAMPTTPPNPSIQKVATSPSPTTSVGFGCRAQSFWETWAGCSANARIGAVGQSIALDATKSDFENRRRLLP